MMCNFNFTLDENGNVIFQDLSIEAISYFWDFGDGTTSTEQNPVHQYKENGTYSCCLEITTTYGTYSNCQDIKVETAEEEDLSFMVYVSTSSQSLVINIPEEGYYKVFIFDTSGRPAYSYESQLQESTVFEVGLTNLPPGVYIVTIESEGMYEKTKVIVPLF
jgi:PKD repeat protein